MKIPWLILAAALAAAGPASAYEILLDLDIDGDPATINTLTYETSATVRVVLWPTEPDELVNDISFGLGGSCVECERVHQYGVTVDWNMEGDWTDHPDLVGTWNGITLLGCPADVGHHVTLEAQPLIDFFVVDRPIFIAALPAEVAPPVPAGCVQPPANLAAFGPGNTVWNYVQLGGPAIANEGVDWHSIKSIYR